MKTTKMRVVYKKKKQGDCKTVKEGLDDGGHLAETGQPTKVFAKLNELPVKLLSAASSTIIDTFCCVFVPSSFLHST